MSEPQNGHDRWLVALGAAFGGFVYASFVGLLALLMGGAGHGWTSGSISWPGVFLVPLACVSWVFRSAWGSRVMAILILVLAVAVDIRIVIAARLEGFEYFEKVAAFGIVWLILWLAWQVALLALVLGRDFRFKQVA